MCRNIKPLFNFDPPATNQEIEAACLQFVRKVSGFTKPSQINQSVFDLAVQKITLDAKDLLDSLQTQVQSRNREEENQKAQLKSLKRFGS